MTLRPTRWRDLALLAGGAAVAGWGFAVVAYGDLPPLPPTFGASMFVIAVAELLWAPSVRARLAGRSRTKPIMPMVVARTAACAKASSVLGALGAGCWLGMLGYLLVRMDELRAARDDLVPAGLNLAASLLLVVAALRLERVCRTPDPPTGATGDLPPASS